jgi:predicted  nucleic acid-binding Zn-ribbon protein
MVLGGEKTIPSRPIHDGTKKAQIIADLGEIVVKRSFTTSGSYLSIENKDGSKPKSPQAILDQLVGKLSFDPLAFSRMKQDEQLKVIKDLTGLDLSDLDALRAKFYEERTITSRQHKAAVALLNGAVAYPNAPKEEVSVTTLAGELEVLQNFNRAIEKGEEKVKWSEIIVNALQDDLTQAKKRLAKVEEDLEAALKTQTDALALANATAKKDDSEIRQKLSTAEETNSQVRANKHRKSLKTNAESLESRVNDLSSSIENIDTEKSKRIAAAKMPVKGLGMTEEGVTFNNMPFDQCSSAEQLKISVAMGIALNPKLKVLLIRDGSLLDEDSMKMLAQMASEADAQVWLERVGDKDKCAVIIEDGAVKEGE